MIVKIYRKVTLSAHATANAASVLDLASRRYVRADRRSRRAAKRAFLASCLSVL